MSENGSAPGGLALVEALVNTRDLELDRDALDTVEGRAVLGIAEIAEGELAAVKELRESLRAVCLAHAGHAPHEAVTPLGQLLSRAPLLVTVDEQDGTARLTAAEEGPLLSRVAAAVACGPAQGPAAGGTAGGNSGGCIRPGPNGPIESPGRTAAIARRLTVRS
jgi:hypothetical protein